MFKATFRTLESWPHPETTPYRRRVHSNRFSRVTPGRALESLGRELVHLRAGHIVVQLDLPASSIRDDGLPRADSRPRTPRVAISFNSRFGPLSYYCDAANAWHHNVRAIALTLERLRLADLYGVTRRGEQYQGFQQLPSGIPVGPATLTLEEAATIVAAAAADMSAFLPQYRVRGVAAGAEAAVANVETFQTIYRLAAKRHHPDAGGSVDAWHKLQAAADVLKKHHRIG